MKAKHFNPLVALAAGFMFVNTSCSKVEDLYNQPSGDGIELIPNGNISSAFNWATTKAINVQIAVDDQFDGKYFYKLEIFDREPHAEGATLLAAGVAKKSQDLKTTASIPTGLQYIYVKQTSPVGIESYSMLEVTGTAITKSNIAGGIKAATISTKGISLLAATTTLAPATAPVPPTVPSDAREIAGSTDVDWNTANANKKLYIKEGAIFTGAIPLNAGIANITVYVEGTWNRGNNDITLGAKNTIIVLGKGKIVARDLAMPSENPVFTNFGTADFTGLTANNTGSISNYNVLNVTNTLNIPSQGTFVNTGTFKATDVNINSEGKFNNSGTVTLTGSINLPSKAEILNTGTATFNKVTGNSNDGTLTNRGHMSINDLNFTNSVFNVNCHTVVGTVSNFNGAKVNIADGAKLEITTITKSGGVVYTLAAKAMLDVKNEVTFTTQTNTITGEAGSLARFKKINLAGHNSVNYNGSVAIATNNHPTNPQNDVFYVVNGSARIVGYDNTSIVISNTGCNDGGFNNPAPNPPVDQKPKEITLGTYSYAFEDNWPSTTNGDYDMNDFVVDVQVVKYQNANNKTEKLVLKNKIRAIGASKHVSAGIQLDNVLAGNVKSVTYSKQNLLGSVISLNSKGIEEGQANAVVSIVDNGHAAFGKTIGQFIFTHDNSSAPVETNITIEFNTPIDNFTQEDLNPFIVNLAQTTGGRYEVHLVGRKATDKINQSLIAKQQSAQGELSADPFKTKSNEPFALSTPVSFAYPKEGVRITTTYPDFMEWAVSNGMSKPNWYNNKVN